METVKGSFDLDIFFHLSPDLFCISGYDGYLKKVNASVSALLEYPPEVLYSRPVNDFVHPEDRHFTEQQRDLLRQGQPLLHFENRYITASGRVVWLTWTSMPVPEQEVIYAIARDITHKKRVESDRNRLLADLTRMHQELKQLSYTSSHDLRGPISNLLALFGLVDQDSIQDPALREFIDIFQSATHALKANVDHYVDLLGESHPANHTETLRFQTVLDHVLLGIQALVQGARVSLQVDFSACPEVSFPRAHLESIFLNLLTNAIKYAHPDRFPEISISSRYGQQGIELIIEDNGLGFDLDAVGHKVFGLHQTFHVGADSKGIGLYLVNSYLKSCGGSISLESQLNKGSRFTLVFPEAMLV